MLETTKVNEKEAKVGPFLKNLLSKKDCLQGSGGDLTFKNTLPEHPGSNPVIGNFY